MYFTYFEVLVAHNGFAFDFNFLVAEVKHCKLDEIFEGIHIYFADTLFDARRVCSMLKSHWLLHMCASFCTFSS